MSGNDLRAFVLGCLLAGVVGCASVPSATPEPAAAAQNPLPVNADTILNVQMGKTCCKPPSILDFLGITQIAGGVGKVLQPKLAHLGTWLGSRFPSIQPKPPLKSLTDPANLSEDASPAAKAAAEAKAEEEAAAQEAVALAYLGQIGCGGCNQKVEEALLLALDDCREVVRFAAVSALRASTGHPCIYCDDRPCCSPKVRAKLFDVAYKMREEDACFVEPSARVRRVARIVLECCGGPPDEGEPTPAESVPQEGPTAQNGAVRSATASVARPVANDESAPSGASAPPPPAEQREQRPEVQLVNAEQRTVLRQELPPEQLLATVNEIPLYYRDVAQEVNRRMLAQRGQQTRQQLLDQEVQRAVDELVLYHHHPRKKFLLPPNPEDQLAAENVAFFRQQGRYWLEQAVPAPNEISVEDVRRHYVANLARYQSSPRVRWEQITVPGESGLSAEQAVAVLSFLRDRALGRATEPPPGMRPDLVQVHGHEIDMTKVESPAIAQQLVGLEVGRLGPIVQDQAGWHLLRVLARQPAQPVPFESVADSIRQELASLRLERQRRDFLARVRGGTQIWIASSVIHGGA